MRTLFFLILTFFVLPELIHSNTKINDNIVVKERDFLPVNQTRVKLGRLLFYDNILSGNRNISCGTCHNHDLHTADGLSLGVGEGGSGIGLKRTSGQNNTKIKKNSIHLCKFSFCWKI